MPAFRTNARNMNQLRNQFCDWLQDQQHRTVEKMKHEPDPDKAAQYDGMAQAYGAAREALQATNIDRDHTLYCYNAEEYE